MDKELKARLVPVLREKEFKGSYPHFRRFKDDKIDIIGIQFSQWGPQFYIEIAVGPVEGVTLLESKQVLPDSLKHYHVRNRTRIGGNSFDYEQHLPGQLAEQAVESLVEAERWWEASKP